MGKRLLIYYPPNNRSIGLNAVVDLLTMLDTETFLLTQKPWGQLHEDLEHKLPPGHCFASKQARRSGIFFYLHHLKELVRFCKTHRIDIIFSHLQPANLVSVMAERLLPRVQVIYFRHHFHYYKKFRLPYLKVGRNELLGEKIVNRFARQLVVPSETVKRGMIEYEGVSPAKIRLLPYIYNFEEYPQIDKDHVETIRRRYPADLLLLMCSRFVEPKRHDLVIDVMHRLVNENKRNVHLLLLDDGPLRETVLHSIHKKGLDHSISFIGFTTSVLDYMAAADLLVHPSLAEASNSSVKEMALAERPSAVCKGIGDFEDYIIHLNNGFLMDPQNTGQELLNIIEFALANKNEIHAMGKRLKKAVIQKYSPSEAVRQAYQTLIT